MISELNTVGAAGNQDLSERFAVKIAAEIQAPVRSVSATARLLAEGATVPFIARYRKEATGSLDEVAITTIRDRLTQLADLESRREAILKSLEERELLFPELRAQIEAAETMTALEDIFAPYRPKRRTRAAIAREKGLEPLAAWLLQHQQTAGANPATEAGRFVVASDNKDLAVPTAEDALAGARDILAEQFSDHADARREVRTLFERESAVSSHVMYGKENDPEAAKYRDYFQWSEPLAKTPSHRLLAMRRGEQEGHLILQINVEEAKGMQRLKDRFVAGAGPIAQQVALACEDGYRRLLAPSIETEMRLASKLAADTAAVRVFAENLRELLMAAPLGQKRVLAIDPGFRTGCKVAVLDAQGKLLADCVIHPSASSPRQVQEARDIVSRICKDFQIEAIAIGNGTASRETEAFVQSCGLPKAITVVMVNESGASVYSASEVAREEFPDKDITVRGAVSIGRRLMDPLAELVKIDPKSIGVGQYQHDVDQNLLKQSLDDTVVSCVNRVGVEVNTASRQLLSYVSGLNQTTAANIVSYRDENGPFHSRDELKKVPRLGKKTFEQAAGFLRIRDASNPLDASAVHPESYPIVERMASDLKSSVADLVKKPELRQRIQLDRYVTETAGLPTLQDIVNELAKPGRDPRRQFEVFQFATGIEKMTDLKPGMRLPGIVTNVTAFGAFVDIGVHQDGLVHVSQLADRFIKDPSEVVKVSQRVTVTVVEVDLERKRIGLSMLAKPNLTPRAPGAKDKSATGFKPQAKGPGNSASAFGSGWFDQALNAKKPKAD
jgi:uncharacterized protein